MPSAAATQARNARQCERAHPRRDRGVRRSAGGRARRSRPPSSTHCAPKAAAARRPSLRRLGASACSMPQPASSRVTPGSATLWPVWPIPWRARRPSSARLDRRCGDPPHARRSLLRRRQRSGVHGAWRASKRVRDVDRDGWPRAAAVLRRYQDPAAVAQRVLELVNAARGAPRECGRDAFAAAPPLAPSSTLMAAASLHSLDMAERGSLGHEGSDGSASGDRMTRAGYVWQASGRTSQPASRMRSASSRGGSIAGPLRDADERAVYGDGDRVRLGAG